MAIKFFDNVRHAISNTPGTGDLTFGAAPAGWQSFSDAGAADGNEPPVRITDGDAWELSYLTLAGTVTTATRTLVASSTGSLLNLTSAASLTCVPFAENVLLPATDAEAQAKSAPDKALVPSNLAALVGDTVVVGDIIITLDSSARSGFVELDGSTITGGVASYPLIASRYSNMVSGSDIKLPDWRGLALRGWDNGAGVDPDAASRTANWSGGPTGDNPGSEQQDEIVLHVHVLPTSQQNTVQAGSSTRGGSANTDSGATGGNETRMKNVGVLFQMRLI